MDAALLPKSNLANIARLINVEAQEQKEEEEEEEKEEYNRNSSDSISISMSSVSSSTLLPMHQRYRNKRELEVYSHDVLGKEKLDTFIVPDIEKILLILKKNM